MGNNKNKPQITVVDQTMREGMQFMGLMFSHDERMQILKFQEEAGVDITEAGYPPAHESERIHIHDLLKTAEKNHYHTRVSGLARAVVDDAASMIDSGLKLFHLHISVPKQINQNQNNQIDIIMQPVIDAIDYIRKKKPFSEIHISILDVGKTEPDILLEYADIFARKLEVNVLKLPDTSGMLTPNLFFKQVRAVADQIGDTQTRIGVHCHNDLGMANANTIMGVEAGATVIDVSALGIGERNGIGDLFIVGKCLAEQGYQLNLKVYNLPVFKSYYEFINFICVNQCGFQPLNYSTPFCAGIKTHVAGTHGKDQFGIRSGEASFLNVLCGRRLVGSYLSSNQIQFKSSCIDDIVSSVKSQSVGLNRRLTKKEIVDIVDSNK